MMKIPLSIITISYNNIEGLKKTVESVLSQTTSEFEYIIIDGGSKDGTKDFLLQKDKQISYWVSEPDSGIYNAMNKGIQSAKGEYLLFLNSGDELSDNNVLCDFLLFEEKNKDADIIYGDYTHKYRSGNLETRTMPDELSLEWFFNASIIHGSTFIRRQLFKSLGHYEEEYKIVADWLFFFKSFLQPNITFLHFPRYIMVFEEGGLSTRISSQNLLNYERSKGIKSLFNKDLLQILEEHSKYVSYWKKLRLDSLISFLKFVNTFFKKIKILPKIIGDFFSYHYNSLHTLLYYKEFKLKNEVASRKIPIIINNRNRVSFPSKLIESLVNRGYNNIYIIDNDSTYSKINDFYQSIPYHVYHLDSNVGFCALWDSSVFDDFREVEYIYTDSDVMLSDSCANDIICKMLFYLNKYKTIDKVGLGLMIDDLPGHYPLKNKVIEWETSLISKARKLEKHIIQASVDTTFALYRKNTFGPAGYLHSLRILGNDQLRHLPWYIDPNNISQEEQYYMEQANTNFYAYWTGLIKEVMS